MAYVTLSIADVEEVSSKGRDGGSFLVRVDQPNNPAGSPPTAIIFPAILNQDIDGAPNCYGRFNPASPGDVSLFQVVLDGDHLLRGFRNAEIREALYGSIEDAGQRRRQSHAVGRMLKRLHVRGLIVKVPHSHRWHVSGKGHQVLGAVVRLDHYGIPAAVGRAA